MGGLNHSSVRDQLKVYLVAGTRDCSSPLPHVLNESLSAGITMFQFREKGPGSLEGEMKKALALQLFNQCREASVPFIVNDDTDLAEQIDADGLHVGQEDDDAYEARKRIGKHKILGVSVHTVEEAYKAIEAGADYLGAGPIYATGSKADAEKESGPEWISELRRNGVDIPIAAIGGISQSNGTAVIRAGADGLAVISAITKAGSPYQAVKEFRGLFTE
ncbi:thiamine phosphate synthase [Alteribacter natronophilus]|uniref:thiamine phosphate synthase n=1 Tax=Alteribacter natronophilus TaxID=2583810 RepID=UPI00110D6D3F|nr:thiamine phosphate synthase [Alteribacter natronophilus]TMW73041.1 thiamine phosphate synthase [Alteribacter natronophilus]